MSLGQVSEQVEVSATSSTRTSIAFTNPPTVQPQAAWILEQNGNISLAKTFQITESLRVDLRGEAFNLFNRTIFGTGSTNLNAGTFGVVQNQVNDPRQMQVGLKVYW